MLCNVVTFGAIGDGIHDDTAAIQSAINTCCEHGGGKVILPGGKIFRCGALRLGSNMEFHLETGAVLKGADNLDAYRLFGKNTSPKKRSTPSYVNCEYAGAPTHFFLYAKDCQNLSITGRGIIDGNEEIFYGEVTKWHIEGLFYPRAPMLFAENCDQLTIQDVTFRRSAFWTVHLVGCRDVQISGIRILNNLRMANCDGIDPDHCQNVRIEGCHIECADDCIVFKNTAAAMQYGPCENITVTNCTLISTSAAIKFGSESEAPFRNIIISNCAISRSNRGISMQLRDKGCIENVLFHNLTIQTRLFHKDVFWGKAEPIAITALRRKNDTKVGTIRNIRFSNIFCESENGILLYGELPNLIENIRFEGVCVHLRRKTNHELGVHDLRPTIGPESTQAGLALIHAHNVNNVRFRDCQWTSDDGLYPRLCVRENCQNFRSEDGDPLC